MGIDRTRWKILILLSVATFFEGFDFLALSQVLPALSEEFHLEPRDTGMLVAFCNIGTVLAWGLVRYADRIGRRRVLAITIAGYTIGTLFTGLAPTLVTFALAQLVARTFLLAEWGLSMVYAAEEFPAEQRGMAIGVIQTASTAGAIACAAIVPSLSAEFGWRSIFLVGVLPLLLLAVARRWLPETQRFAQGEHQARKSWLDPWRAPQAYRILQLGAIWAATYLCTQAGIVFWKEFAISEGGLDDHQVALALTIASVGALPLLASVGWVIDTLGRRRGAVVVYVLTVVGIFGSYNLHGQWPLTAALVLGVFGSTAVLPVLNAWSTELFPTSIRSEAYGWANYVLGRSAYVLAPLMVGAVAQVSTWRLAVSLTTLGPLLALALIWAWMPETARRELEQTSAAA